MKKYFYWLIFALHLAITLYFWFTSSGDLLGEGGASLALALGRLAGLLAASLVLLQVMLMGRARWLEPVFGLDKLAIIHRKNGQLLALFLIAHPLLIVSSYASFADLSFWTQYTSLANAWYILLASAAFVLFLFIIGYSIIIVRRKWNFEWWYLSHLLVYVAIAFAFFHQVLVGGDLLASDFFKSYWIAAYIFVFGNLLVFRFGLPLWNGYKHKFRVLKVVPETHDVTSVYITGNNLQTFSVKPGQFFIVRFLDKTRFWQAHPFSLSKYPDGGTLRLSIKNVGDFTATIPGVSPGTRVLVEGPYGAFTKTKLKGTKALIIAGGIGITPIRGLVEEFAKNKKDIVLFYANKTEQDIALKNELEILSATYSFPIHHVLSSPNPSVVPIVSPLQTMDTGYINHELIQKYTPDSQEREVFLCGPPPMMTAVIGELTKLGIPKSKIYYERFALN